MFIYRIYVNKVKKIAVLFNLSDGLNRTNCSDKYPFGGADEDRTRYLLSANQMLSQMSYSPMYITGFFYPGIVDKWSGKQDSNLRPPDPKSGALPSCAISRFFCDGALGKNRTRNLQIRSLTLYPVELLAQA